MAKKKTKEKPAAGHKAWREVLGIMLVGLGLLSLIALISSRAPFLSGLIKTYRLIFGIAIYSLPVVLVFTGLYTMGMKRAVGKLAANILLAAMWVAAIVHLLKFRGDTAVCFSHDALVRGGGFVCGYPACIMDKFFGAAAGTLNLIAAAIIYFKLATGISYLAIYEKIALKCAPFVSNIKTIVVLAMKVMTGRLGEMGRVMAENRKERLEALRAEQEKRREENNKRLMEQIKALAPTGNNSAPDTKKFALVDEEPAGEPAPEDELKRRRMGRRAKIEPLAPKEDIGAPLPPPVVSQIEMELSPVLPTPDEEIEEVLVTNGEGEEAISWKLPGADDWLDPADKVAEGRGASSLRDKLEATLKSFQVPATISNVVEGASFTRFEVTLEPGVKVSRIITLENDIALSLAADSRTIRIEAPIPGKSAIGIEVPNKERAVVPMRKIFMSGEFQNMAKGVLTFVMGEDISGFPAWANLVKMPHLLVAGSTNSGKSVCINTIICSIIARQYPEDVRFIMMDMKRVELTPYEGIPHLLTPVVKEADVAASALKWVCEEMDKRYRTFAEVGVRNIDGFNALQEKPEDKLYRIVVVIDELADLMMVALPNMNVETHICRITQLARATGIHMILATQRPDTKVITGTIKNNIPSRISFAVPTQIDSRTILDQKGAESLLGRGDMLYMPSDSNRLLRLQGSLVSDNEVKALVDFWKQQQPVTEYKLKFKAPESSGMPMSGGDSEFISEDEALYKKAVEITISTKHVSISKIQRVLRIGYNRAARMVELMEERGVVGPYDGTNPREVLLSQAGFETNEF